LRLLYSKLGSQHCPGCGRKLAAQSPEQIASQIKRRYKNKEATLLAPKVSGKKGFHKDILAQALRKGFSEARIDGVITRLEKHMALARYHEHTIEVVVGRLPATDPDRVVSQALKEGNQHLIIVDSSGNEEVFSQHATCLVV